MKINLEIVERPMIKEFQLFSKLDTELLNESKTVYVDTVFKSKTRIGTSIQVGMYSVGMNWEIEGFKTDTKTHYNYFTYKSETAHYFKLSKKQGLEEYKEYLKKMVELFLKKVNYTQNEVTIKLYDPKF